jgi:outer membrane protein OmpA-like peptidoglycan-associated protein
MKQILLVIFLFLSLSGFTQTASNGTELAPTEKEGLIKFIVNDPKGIPEEGAEVTVESNDKSIIRKAIADINGKGAVLFPKGVPYKIIVRKFETDFEMGEGVFEQKPGFQKLNLTLTIEIVTTYLRMYELNKLYFEPGKFEISGLKEGSIQELNRVLDSLKANPKMKIEIAGHTDNVGEDQANLQLSQKRADAIRDYLILKGINGERILAKGYGEIEPVATNDTPEGRARNRRTEIRIIQE